MSNFLAIGTVTAALRRLLQQRLDVDVPGAQATVDRPGSKSLGALTSPGVNIFLYQASPNPTFRAADLPTRRADGTLLVRPTIGLDLHYLMTFFGDETKLEPQRVLGSVVSALHAQPVVTDQLIQSVKAAAAPPLPTQPTYPELRDTDLADQIDSIRLTPAGLTLEELSKLWSVFFQSAYQLSMAYQASVVLIEDKSLPQPSRPVLQRGVAAEALRKPVVTAVEATPDPAAPITAATTILIKGRDLVADSVTVRVFGLDAPAASATGSEVRLDLSTVAIAAARAGDQPLQVVRRRRIGDPPTLHSTAVSDVALFVLHPRVQTSTVTGSPAARRVRVTLDVTVAGRQSVALLLLDPGTAAQRFLFGGPARTADASTVEIPIADVPSGEYLVQVLVDGAESPIARTASGTPTGPKMTIP
jgi:uncharacterized protein DUF4255